ncbi:protein arginine N-methyltransferase 7-like isoform X2 [Ornithodoros turicata]|uniref:protein arginine N-methyltransferase 7-like isoform X2 n=1 Tax=Ornithodoros turicata TaxID=34597 RepID=UPI0031392B27
MNMSVLEPHFSPVTGRMEWELRPDEYDHHQEIARSAFADMLHDTERNRKYHLALREAIDQIRKQGKKVKVLDIGTGSGLLAMMAAEYGADSVHACEAFLPVAEKAEHVIADNKLSNKIQLIRKRSTEVQVGKGKDMEEKANLLVTEVFDTELIGEGAIETFTHALQELLEPDSIVVPQQATVYAQVVHSPFLYSFHTLLPLEVTPQSFITVPESIRKCAGAPAVHDLQLSQLQPSEFIPLSQPVPVFRFDFNDVRTLAKKDQQVDAIVARETGKCHVVLMWWELAMDQGKKIILSCAPYWAHPEGQTAPWRDHWMQGVYYVSHALEVERGETFYLNSCRDEYSMWFAVDRKTTENVERPICLCGLHMIMSRTRIAMLNDVTRQQKYICTLQKVVAPSSVCLCLGSGSQLPLIAAKLGAKMVYAVETDKILQGTLKEYIAENHINNITVLDDIPFHLPDSGTNKVDIFMAEPYFSTSLLPWHNLQFWFLRPSVSHLFADGVVTIPCKAVIRAMAVEFSDLWKIRAPVVQTEGFDLTSFDKLVEVSQNISDDVVEPQPLWEYPCTALTDPFVLAAFDLSSNLPSTACHSVKTVGFQSNGTCNGVAVWMDFELDSNTVVTTGPTEQVQPGRKVQWDHCSRQGAYFFKSGGHLIDMTHTNLTASIELNASSGTIQFTFVID